MKWLVGIALILSASLVVPVLIRYSESTNSNGRLAQIHELM